MRSFQQYFSQTKDSIFTQAEAIYQSSPLLQGIVEGLGAPIVGYAAYCNSLNESEMLRDAWKSAKKLNIKLMAAGFIGTMYHERVIHADLTELSQACSSHLIKFGLYGLDKLTLGAIHLVLIRELSRAVLQNLGFLSTIQYSAEKVMPISQHFPAGEGNLNKMLGKVTGNSLVATSLHYGTDVTAWGLRLCFPGGTGDALSFVLESFVYGGLLINFKLGAAELSNKDFMKKWQENLLYIMFYGASFVIAKKLVYESLSLAAGGAKNYYSKDAIHQVLFDFFVMMSIARSRAFPGDNQASMDIWAMLKPYLDTPIARQILKHFLAELYSLEDLIKSKAVSQAISVREKDLKEGVDTLKDSAKKIEEIKSSKLIMIAKWLGYILPGIIPTDVIDTLQKIGRDYLSTMIVFIESTLDTAIKADQEHHEIKPVSTGTFVTLEEKKPTEILPKLPCEVIVNQVPIQQNREVILSPEKLKNESITNIPQIITTKEKTKEPIVLNISPDAKPITSEVPKPAPVLAKEEETPTGLRSGPILNENYFGQGGRVREEGKLSYPLSENYVALFNKPQPKPIDNQAAMVVDIITTHIKK